MEETEEFADPEHEGGGADYRDPGGEPKGLDAEEIASECHNKNLTDKNDEGNEAESSASFEVEGRAAGFEGTRIEHVPELEEDECGEEERDLVR